MLFSCAECYCHRCVIDGVWKWEYETLSSCTECTVTYNCYDVATDATTVVASCDDCVSDILPGRCMINGQWYYGYTTQESCEQCEAYCTPDYWSEPYALVSSCSECEALYGGVGYQCWQYDPVTGTWQSTPVASCSECYGYCQTVSLYPRHYCYTAWWLPCGQWHPNDSLYSCTGTADCPPGHACIGGKCVTKNCTTTEEGTCGDWACGSCCRCYQISGSGFPVTEGCYILTDLTEHVDALGDWPMFPGEGCGYYRAVFDSDGVYYEFSASLSMPWPDGGTATLTITLKVAGVTVATWTYEKEVSGPWSAPVTFEAGDITSQDGDVCSGGTFEVSPCRCKCAKRGGFLPKDPNAYGIRKGRDFVNDPPLNGNGTYWIAEVPWTGYWICVDPWTVPGLAAGDRVYNATGYAPEVSGVPTLPASDCVCGDGVESSEQCAWTATLETDHNGNKVPLPSLQSGYGPCEENPLP